MAFSSLKEQWHHPSGVFSVLLLVRGDIIQKAIAQLAGGPFNFTPVAFSFGWVSFGVTTLLSALGEGRLMSDVGCPSIVTNASNGYRRTNMSWVLGRVLRDWEIRCPSKYPNPALIVTIFKLPRGKSTQSLNNPEGRTSARDLEQGKRASEGRTRSKGGVPALDFVWYMGIVVMVLQCIIAAVAGFLKGDWLIFVVTVGGTLLAIAGGALPQWGAEKSSSRKVDERHIARYGPPAAKSIVLTRGNGHRHVLILYNESNDLNLEDKAIARTPRHPTTLPLVLILAICWILLLLMVSALRENGWYLIVVGGLGMAQNLFAAGHHRDSSALGIHLSKPDIVLPNKPKKDKNGVEIQNKVFQVIKKIEKKMDEEYGVRRVGILLLSVFFPDGLRPHEVEWKREREARYEDKDKAADTVDDLKNRDSEKHLATKQKVGKAGRSGPLTERPLFGGKTECQNPTVEDAIQVTPAAIRRSEVTHSITKADH